MGLCISKDESSNGANTKRNVRVVVLGIAGCGKSTFSRQLKFLYGGGFTNEERVNYKNVLISNLFLGFRETIDRANDSEIKFGKDVKKSVRFFSECNAYDAELDSDAVSYAQALWKDAAFQKYHNGINNHEFNQSMSYIMENLTRIADPTWIPSDEDIVRVRQRTTGMVETSVKIENYRWSIIDVGGHRVERRKWIHSINPSDSTQKLHCSIFFFALDEYDVPSEEIEGKTKFEEALDVWSETINGPIRHLPIAFIVFLNKRDLFEKKIKELPLKNTFKKYKGKSVDDALKYMKDLVLNKCKPYNSLEGAKPVDPNKQCSADVIYVHNTVAIDANNIKLVFESCRDFIVKQRLETNNL